MKNLVIWVVKPLWSSNRWGFCSTPKRGLYALYRYSLNIFQIFPAMEQKHELTARFTGQCLVFWTWSNWGLRFKELGWSRYRWRVWNRAVRSLQIFGDASKLMNHQLPASYIILVWLRTISPEPSQKVWAPLISKELTWPLARQICLYIIYICIRMINIW